MEAWVLYAVGSLFLAGIFNFGMKIITKRNYDTSYVSTIWYITGAVCGIAYYLYLYGSFSFQDWFLLLIWLAFLERLFFFISTLARVESLHNIDTTLFFPLYKTVFPVLITLISFFALWENLTLKEFLWIFLWILVPLFLITKKENTIQVNLKKWIIYMLIVSIASTLAVTAAKYSVVKWLNIEMFLIVSYLIWIVIWVMTYKLMKRKSRKVYSKEGVYWFWILLWFIQFLSFYCFINAINWHLAIAVTINSFSILIPIILSVIFYKEEMTYKKAFVIFLSIVSVVLFI